MADDNTESRVARRRREREAKKKELEANDGGATGEAASSTGKSASSGAKSGRFKDKKGRGKPQDKRNVREKRRATGIIKLDGSVLDESDDEVKVNTELNETIAVDSPESSITDSKRYGSRLHADSSNSDISLTSTPTSTEHTDNNASRDSESFSPVQSQRYSPQGNLSPNQSPRLSARHKRTDSPLAPEERNSRQIFSRDDFTKEGTEPERSTMITPEIRITCDDSVEKVVYDDRVEQIACEDSVEQVTCDDSVEQITCEDSIELVTCNNSVEQVTCDDSVEQVTCDDSVEQVSCNNEVKAVTRDDSVKQVTCDNSIEQGEHVPHHTDEVDSKDKNVTEQETTQLRSRITEEVQNGEEDTRISLAQMRRARRARREEKTTSSPGSLESETHLFYVPPESPTENYKKLYDRERRETRRLNRRHAEAEQTINRLQEENESLRKNLDAAEMEIDRLREENDALVSAVTKLSLGR
ncbi:protein starmaker-like [Ptychodera flava]|uniref:protein starmaker-like n=1 Tax=Ptychodera flava TaxID=63121 RepID=UPI00396AA132